MIDNSNNPYKFVAEGAMNVPATIYNKKTWDKINFTSNEKNILENAEIKERVKKGLDLTFEKLVKTKSQNDGVFVLSQNGVIKKVKASDLNK